MNLESLSIDDMILLSYDISDDKLRRHFSKHISKYGHRIQYSVFEIDNSQRILDNIILEIDKIFGKKFSETDSVMVCKIKSKNDIIKYGYAKHDDDEVIIV